MKKVFSIILMIVSLIICVSCGNKNITNSGNGNIKTDLIVFAAASMTETMNEIKPMYEAKHNDINIIYNFDSSGTLLKQILSGAYCDIFISAAKKQMDTLDTGEYLLDGSKKDFLENKVVLAVPDGNKKDVKNFSDILTDKVQMIAIGNSDVPVGSYTLDIFKYLGISEDELNKKNKLTYGSNAKEVTTHIKENLVDCGIIYATDARSANLTIVDRANGDMCKKVIYPLAILKDSKNIEIAKEFIEFLHTDEAFDVFKGVGFTKP